MWLCLLPWSMHIWRLCGFSVSWWRLFFQKIDQPVMCRWRMHVRYMSRSHVRWWEVSIMLCSCPPIAAADLSHSFLIFPRNRRPNQNLQLYVYQPNGNITTWILRWRKLQHWRKATSCVEQLLVGLRDNIMWEWIVCWQDHELYVCVLCVHKQATVVWS